MGTTTTDIVQKLWNLCTLLREDGVTYHQYVTKLTYLLFLKMMKEQKREAALPRSCRWDDLTALEGVEQLDFYKQLLLALGKANNRLVRDIYENAGSTLKKPKTLAALVKAFDELDWYSAEREGLGEEARRLALMNMLLHDIEGDLRPGDTLSPLGAQLTKADVILTNPPFGTKAGGGKPSRDDFTFPTSNKQLAFVEHVYRGLKPGGRAAIVVPDNVMFADNVGRENPHRPDG
jgi:type I restriction-modification system DNA methylase subunit